MTINTYGSATDTTDVALSISSDMGSLSFGSAQNSAADAMDGMPGKAGMGLAGTDTIVSKDYNDGDAATGHGLQYTSPSMNGWTAKVSTGFGSTQGVNATTSVAVSGSIAGISLAAGIAQIGAAATPAVETAAAVNGVYTLIGTPLTPIVISNNTGLAADVNSVAGAAALVEAGTHRLVQAYTPAATAAAAVGNDHDDTFITASYSLGDISLGYGLYSSDAAAGDSASSISVSMPFAGMTAGIQYGEADNSGAAADDDGYRIGLVKSMGAGATFSVEYTDITTGVTTDDNPTSFRVGYMVSF
jgi:predicted porin